MQTEKKEETSDILHSQPFKNVVGLVGVEPTANYL